MKAFAQALRAQARALATLADAIENGDSAGDDWIDARNAPRSARWFWAVARSRDARGEQGVSIHGRRCLMTRAALAEELSRASTGKRRAPTTAPATEGVRGELERELRIFTGGR